MASPSSITAQAKIDAAYMRNNLAFHSHRDDRGLDELYRSLISAYERKDSDAAALLFAENSYLL